MEITGFKKRKGAALISSIFIAIVGMLVTMSMMAISSSNTNQITDDKSGTSAYYAAEAGLEEVKNLFNSDDSNLGVALANLDLPGEDSPAVLSNNASYWVDSISYSNDNKSALIYIIGKNGEAFRKIRAKMDTSIPDIYNDYGLLTNGVLTIHGTKTLKMNVHANNGLSFTGGTAMENNAVATQSSDPTADPPNSEYNPVGGYVPELDVPAVPISDYRIKSKEDGILLNINQADLMTSINNAPAGSKIYISGSTSRSVLKLSGDMQEKFIFIDGDIRFYANGINDLSNVMVVAAGNMDVDGSVDIVTSHEGQIDAVLASGGDIRLDGSRNFDCMFWGNKTFRQNGASIGGRVISQEAILFNGKFTLSQSNELYNNGAFDQVINVSSWQLVPTDS